MSERRYNDAMSQGSLFSTDHHEPIETQLHRRKFRFVAGADEAGCGCLAGPVVAAAVILRNLRDEFVASINDSKQLRPTVREELEAKIRARALAVGVGVIGNEEIDQINILQARLKAMRMAVEALQETPDFIVVDGTFVIPLVPIPQRSLVQGDARCKSVGAASIVAKVYRDRLMAQWHETYPQYNFLANKGYGTADHWEALRKHGPCPLHRMSFHGVGAGDTHALAQLELRGANDEEFVPE